MQAIRTILWVLLAIVMVAFIAINWVTVPINIWPIAGGTYLHFNWPIGFVVLISFLLGLLPMWLLHKGSRWRLNRRIGVLESNVATANAPLPAPAPVPTVTTASPPLDDTARETARPDPTVWP